MKKVVYNSIKIMSIATIGDFISRIDETFLKSFNLLYTSSLTLEQAISKLKNDYGTNFVDYRDNSHNNAINLLMSNDDYMDFMFNFMGITFLTPKLLQSEDEEEMIDKLNLVVESFFKAIQEYKEKQTSQKR